MDQNLSLYKIFSVVASTGNISAAAKKLFISQPAISKSINRLEESLKVRLFVRGARGVTLTEEGRLLQLHVNAAFESIDSAEAKLKQIADLGMGHVRIGVSTTLCKYMLMPYLKDFIRSYPHIRITLHCQSTNETLSMLTQGHIDIGLIAKPEHTKNIHFHALGEIQDTFVATKTYLDNLKLRESMDTSTIFDVATLMLLDQNNMTRKYIDDYLSDNHIIVNNLLEITSMDLLIDFAKIGMGVACIIREFIIQELTAGALVEVPLAIPIHKRTVGFAYNAAVLQPQAVQNFIDFCM